MKQFVARLAEGDDLATRPSLHLVVHIETAVVRNQRLLLKVTSLNSTAAFFSSCCCFLEEVYLASDHIDLLLQLLAFCRQRRYVRHHTLADWYGLVESSTC